MILGLIKKTLPIINEKEREIYNDNLFIIKNMYSSITYILLIDIININKKHELKCKKMNYFDVFYFLIQKSAFNHTYDSIIDQIYEKFNLNVSSKMLRQKFNLININIISTINKKLIDYYYNINKNKNKERILCCDGTVSKTYISLKKENFNPVKTDSYCNFYISTIYDSDRNIPIAWNINKTKNERSDFIQLMNIIKENDIIVFDRGYPSYEFMKLLNDKNIKYIIRLTEMYDVVSDINNKNIFDEVYNEKSSLYKGTPFRVIKYIIKNKNNNDSVYYLATNLFDIKIDKFKDLYFKRWKIEVFYNKLKNYVNGNYYDVRTSDELYKSVEIHFFVLILTRIFMEISSTIFNSDNNDSSKILNFRSAQRTVINSIMKNFIYDVDNYTQFFSDLLKINNNKVFSIPDRSFIRFPTKENIDDNDKEKLKIISRKMSKNIIKNEITNNKIINNKNIEEHDDLYFQIDFKNMF